MSEVKNRKENQNQEEQDPSKYQVKKDDIPASKQEQKEQLNKNLKQQKQQQQTQQPIQDIQFRSRGTMMIPFVILGIAYYFFNLYFPDFQKDKNKQKMEKSQKLLNSFHQEEKQDIYFKQNRELLNDITSEYLIGWSLPNEFQQFDYFEEFSDNIEKEFYGFQNESNFCQRSESFKLMYPGLVNGHKYYISTIAKEDGEIRQNKEISVRRHSLKFMGGEDRNEELNMENVNIENVEKKAKFSLKTSFIDDPFQNFHKQYQVGKQNICNLQLYSNIPGRVFGNQSQIAKNINESSNIINKQECIEQFSNILHAYNLNEKQECKQFFEDIKQQNSDLSYININQNEKLNLEEIKSIYNNGNACSDENEDQQLIVKQTPKDRMKLNDQYFKIKAFVAVTSTLPLKVYVYQQPFITLCKDENDFVCDQYTVDLKFENLQNQKQILQQINEFVANSVLNKEIGQNYYDSANVYQLFQADFILNNESELYLQDIYNFQDLYTKNGELLKSFNKMYYQMYTILYQQLQGRFSRIQRVTKTYFQKFTEAHQSKQSIESDEIQEFKKKYIQANKNYYDHLQRPLKGLQFLNVYDEGDNSSSDKYLGFQFKQCAKNYVQTE